MNLPEQILRAAERHADRAAIRDDGETCTYRELVREARRLGGLLARRCRSDTVGIILPTGKAFHTAWLAALWAGKIPVPVNFLLQPEEVRFILEDCGADTVVTARFFEKLVPDEGIEPLYLDRLGWMDKLSALLLPAAMPDRGESDIATLLYTSGTTGKPKGVALTHGNLLTDAREAAEMAGFDRPLTFLGVLPMFHSFALMGTLVIPLLYGGTVVTHKKFHPRRVLESIEKERIQIVMAVPSMYRLLLKAREAEGGDLSSVEIAIAGGEPLPEDLAVKFENATGKPLLEGYGLTETSPVISLNTPDSHRLGTAGKPLPCLETKVVDLDSGERLPDGQIGELWVRGPIVMKGYHHRPEETRQVLTQDGWLRTGDLCLRRDGYLSIRGRQKELIIVAGENVSPGEIEDVLSSHDAVFEVAVLGSPDPKRGEVPVAYVVLHEGAEADEKDLLSMCREHLAAFKVPRKIVFRRDLPHGPTGKILKRAIETGEVPGGPGREQETEGGS